MIDGVQAISGLVGAKPGSVVGDADLAALVPANPGQLDGANSTAMPSGANFGETLASMATDSVEGLKAAESMSFAALNGKASTREVVDAVMSAEQSLQTALAIRDKIITAYLEVSRMPI